MLLKTVRTPNPVALHIDLQPLTADQATEAVCKLREDFLAGKGILPVISEERAVNLYSDYTIYRVCPETRQLGDFAGDTKLPHNTVAIVCQNLPDDMRVAPIYITSDMEAYVISDTGVTVSVINGKKDVNSGAITMVGGNFKIDSPHVNIHSGTGNQHTGPAK